MPIDSADSTRVKSDTATDIGEKVFRWFTQIGAAVINPIKHFLRTRYSASDEKRAESTLEEAGAIAAATENAVLTTTKSFTVPDTAEVKVDTDAHIDSAASTVPDQEEIQRRRDLVRTLFNDFWSEAHDKPTAFVERLDQAEDYVNERLTACGEFWRLDANTRAMLGLPPRANLPNNGSEDDKQSRSKLLRDLGYKK
jgi:adenosine/AMP kinase